MLVKTLVMLAILLVGIVVLALLFRHDCRKAKRERSHE